MVRKIIRIDEEKCTGCGLCASACHEGAIGMVDGKAKLVRENYCDGFGDCLPACPAGAISFEEREVPAYDEDEVLRTKPSGSRLSQWPVQIKLVPVNEPFLDGADLLIAATCSAFAYGAFHDNFIRGRKVLVGCPKLDGVDYAEKLSAI
ncbi:MAG: 4Fe-4S dicluster domain-containing protein, partial [Bullifex sp.]